MNNKLLIVDDNEFNRDLLKDILCDDYDILEAENGKEALEIIQKEKNNISGILLDLMMPKMDGYEFLENAHKETNVMDKIPVLVISGETNVKNENRCFELGVSDFIGRPFSAVLVKKRIQNAVSHFSYKNKLEEKVDEQIQALQIANKKLQAQTEILEKRNREIIEMLGNIVECRNLESGEHIQRVKGYTRIMALKFKELYPEYNLTKDDVEIIVESSALHDLGKISIPDSILLKPGKLTPEEFECMKSHTIKGCEILDSMHIEWDKDMRKVSYEIIRYHHERFDGKGYPDGLKGDEIPVAAQLVSVADVYDALVNERCYKDAFTKEKAFNMICNGECGTFSPKLMETFKCVKEEFEQFV